MQRLLEVAAENLQVLVGGPEQFVDTEVSRENESSATRRVG